MHPTDPRQALNDVSPAATQPCTRGQHGARSCRSRRGRRRIGRFRGPWRDASPRSDCAEPLLDESLLNCTGQAQQACLSGVFPSRTRRRTFDEVLGHLVLITLDMRADVDAYVLGHAARLRHEHAGRLGGDAGVRPLPTGVNDGEALRRREDHGNAIGKAEHGGHARRRAHDGVGPLPRSGTARVRARPRRQSAPRRRDPHAPDWAPATARGRPRTRAPQARDGGSPQRRRCRPHVGPPDSGRRTARRKRHPYAP